MLGSFWMVDLQVIGEEMMVAFTWKGWGTMNSLKQGDWVQKFIQGPSIYKS
jgi:hypothetical protein